MNDGEVSPVFSSDSRNRYTIFLGCFLCSILFALIAKSKGIELLPDNPTKAVADASSWFWETGSLTRPELQVIFDQAIALSRQQPSAVVWQDRLSLGLDGSLYPKHAVFLSVLCSPFFGLLGVFGFWLVNQLAICALVLGIYSLSRFYCDARSTMLGVLAFLLGTQILMFSYGFHYDIVASAAIVWAFALVCKRPAIAGALITLAFMIRPTNLVFGLALPTWALIHSRSNRGSPAFNWRAFALGFVGVALPILGLNFALWGDPVAGAYARLPSFSKGEIVFDVTTHVFSVSTLISEFLWRAITGGDSIVRWYPAALLLPLGLLKACRLGSLKLSLFALAATSGAFGLLMMGFPSWDGVGSWRFILPSLALAWPLVSCAFRCRRFC